MLRGLVVFSTTNFAWVRDGESGQDRCVISVIRVILTLISVIRVLSGFSVVRVSGNP